MSPARYAKVSAATGGLRCTYQILIKISPKKAKEGSTATTCRSPPAQRPSERDVGSDTGRHTSINLFNPCEARTATAFAASALASSACTCVSARSEGSVIFQPLNRTDCNAATAIMAHRGSGYCGCAARRRAHPKRCDRKLAQDRRSVSKSQLPLAAIENRTTRGGATLAACKIEEIRK